MSTKMIEMRRTLLWNIQAVILSFIFCIGVVRGDDEVATPAKALRLKECKRSIRRTKDSNGLMTTETYIDFVSIVSESEISVQRFDELPLELIQPFWLALCSISTDACYDGKVHVNMLLAHSDPEIIQSMCSSVNDFLVESVFNDIPSTSPSVSLLPSYTTPIVQATTAFAPSATFTPRVSTQVCAEGETKELVLDTNFEDVNIVRLL